MRKHISLGEWLKNKLIFYGWTNKDLCKVLGLKQAIVSMYITNRRTPTVETMEKILEVFGLDRPQSVRRKVESELKHIYHPNQKKKKVLNRAKTYAEELEEKLNKLEFTEF